MMFIETALKNIALNTIMTEIDSSSVYDMYDKAISSYKNAPAGTREDIKKKYQNNKLNLQGSIQNAIAAAYRKENPKITHFYNNVNYNEVPIGAIFEILTMGDFGYLLSCLIIDMREKVSRSIGINLSSDTYRELLYKYVYALKDLRNAIAHNDVVYDTRFKKMDPSRPMKQCLILEMGMPYINFKTIGDYIILICYYLKLLKVSKTEIKSFIREFESVSFVSNTAGVYGAFLKKWDDRALKDIIFLDVSDGVVSNNPIIKTTGKIEDIIEDVPCNILYLDPPYTQNQYGTQYHLLETLVLNDKPEFVSKVTGSRSTREMRSDWSKIYKVHI